MRVSAYIKIATRTGAVLGYLTKEDILIILMIIISGLQLLYDYLKNRPEVDTASKLGY